MPLDLERRCPVCRDRLSVPAYPTAPCAQAHVLLTAVDSMLRVERDFYAWAAGSGPWGGAEGSRAYIRGLHAAPLDVLLWVLAFHASRMRSGCAPEWLARLQGDAREVTDPTLLPAPAQLWEALLERLGAKALREVAVAVVDGVVTGPAHVLWTHGAPWASGSGMVQLCRPNDTVPPLDTGKWMAASFALAYPWRVTCPDCYTLLPMAQVLVTMQLLLGVA